MKAPLLTKRLDDIKQHIEEIDAADLANKLKSKDNFVLLDVRGEENWRQEHLPNAILADKNMLELNIEKLVPDTKQEIVLYCGGGTRSLLSAESLRQMGYTNLKSLKGGFRDWKERGLPLAD